MRRGLPRPKFPFTAYLVIVVFNLKHEFCFTQLHITVLCTNGSCSKEISWVSSSRVCLHSCDRGQLSLKSFTLSLACVSITWLDPQRPPSWTCCWVPKPCCAACPVSDLATAWTLGLPSSVVAPGQQEGFQAVHSLSITQLTRSSLPQKQHISKFLPAATVLECIVVSQPLVFLHLQSFFNSPKLKQFVCSKFIQSLKLYWWLLIPFHQPTRDSQYSFHVIKLTLTYTQSTNLHIFRAYTQLHIIPSKSRT